MLEILIIIIASITIFINGYYFIKNKSMVNILFIVAMVLLLLKTIVPLIRLLGLICSIIMCLFLIAASIIEYLKDKTKINNIVFSFLFVIIIIFYIVTF